MTQLKKSQKSVDFCLSFLQLISNWNEFCNGHFPISHLKWKYIKKLFGQNTIFSLLNFIVWFQLLAEVRGARKPQKVYFRNINLNLSFCLGLFFTIIWWFAEVEQMEKRMTINLIRIIEQKEEIQHWFQLQCSNEFLLVIYIV
jgi:hypothetical protein